MNKQNLSRRDFLRFAGLNAAALLGSRFKFPALMNEPFVPDTEISITAAEK